MDGDSDIDNQQVERILTQLTDHSRILDASVYQLDGTLIAHSGEQISVRDRLALDGKRAGSYFNHQLVESIQGKDGPLGFIRVTLDTHVLATESKQVDNTHQPATPDDPAGAGHRHYSGPYPAARPAAAAGSSRHTC
ncbi:Uncharacterized membrane protein affecting hemolysin expression [Serratia fonticola]|uniref:Uncharacterized membrane protein affecting hemolysin expression n=1 Tax=Serratia fonticola TaxID=47917 RepID=A0A4U9UFX5_SERFO|nr:Uncharacterized membrane protein affecting hemolysin expression [Serratia fonticola]